MNVLISLHKGYGLGDSVQMSAVLRHLVKARPEWKIDYRNEHNVGRGIVANVLTYDQPLPNKHYEIEVQICLYDTWANWSDRPNTRVSSCLHDRFGLPWDRECGRYQVNIPSNLYKTAGQILDSVDRDSVTIHYQGDSSKAKKDLLFSQIADVRDHIVRLGCVPFHMGRHNIWGWDAEMNCAVIAQCKAFVGIDSGPSKCASATDTPSLVVWTGHHPAPFHDPADNTTHLVPYNYHGLAPVCNDKKVIEWFEANHKVIQYLDDPVERIKQWLTETLQ
jgi:hypothetical protein